MSRRWFAVLSFACCLVAGIVAGAMGWGAPSGSAVQAAVQNTSLECPYLMRDPNTSKEVVLFDGALPSGSSSITILAPEFEFKDELDCGNRAYAPRFELDFSMFAEFDMYKIEFQDSAGTYHDLFAEAGTTRDSVRDNNGRIIHETVVGRCFGGDEWPIRWRISNGPLNLTRISHLKAAVICCGCRDASIGGCWTRWVFECDDQVHSTPFMPFSMQCEQDCTSEGRFYAVRIETCNATEDAPIVEIHFDSGLPLIVAAEKATHPDHPCSTWTFNLDNCTDPIAGGKPTFARVLSSTEALYYFQTTVVCCEWSETP